MNAAESLRCAACAHPLVKEVYDVVSSETGQLGPYGRVCAGRVMRQIGTWNIAAKRVRRA